MWEDRCNGRCNFEINERSHQRPYDEYGRIRHNGLDVCDCMNEDCPGCWFECEKCGSTKCGLECRVNLMWNTVSVRIFSAFLTHKFCKIIKWPSSHPRHRHYFTDEVNENPLTCIIKFCGEKSHKLVLILHLRRLLFNHQHISAEKCRINVCLPDDKKREMIFFEYPEQIKS
uniref:ARF7EP_C domain-containing protein n=1 Tax=Glossina brevipalpis TaxID=37001 RepID=A0A1A9WVU0_9MUSC